MDSRTDPRLAFVDRSYQYSYESVDADTGRIVASAQNFVMTSACGLPDGRVLFLRRPSPEQDNSLQLWELQTDPVTGKVLGPERARSRVAENPLFSLSASDDGKQGWAGSPRGSQSEEKIPTGETIWLDIVKRNVGSAGGKE